MNLKRHAPSTPHQQKTKQYHSISQPGQVRTPPPPPPHRHPPFPSHLSNSSHRSRPSLQDLSYGVDSNGFEGERVMAKEINQVGHALPCLASPTTPSPTYHTTATTRGRRRSNKKSSTITTNHTMLTADPPPQVMIVVFYSSFLASTLNLPRPESARLFRRLRHSGKQEKQAELTSRLPASQHQLTARNLRLASCRLTR